VRVVHIGVAVATAVFSAACPWPAGDATAGCVAPYLEDSATGAEPPVLRLGSNVTIEGDAFVDGCNDTGSTWACSAEPVIPMEDVVLRIHQRGSEWELGSADASDGETRGHVQWAGGPSGRFDTGSSDPDDGLERAAARGGALKRV